jgi:hypothetical protein
MRKLWIPLLLMLVFGLVVFVAGPKISGRRISDLFEEYKTCPTKELCEKLAKLLDRQKVETGLGNEILKELTTPLLTVREAYNVEKPVNFRMTHRFPLSFSDMDVLNERSVETEDGQYLYGGSGSGSNTIGNQSRFFHYNPQDGKPGDYKIQVRYRFGLIPYSPRTDGNDGRRKREFDDAVYRCEFVIPVELKVVDKEQAEFVEPVSSPDLDAKMKAAFETDPGNMMCSYGTPSGMREMVSDVQVVYKDCPVDAAFQMSFRFENGRVQTCPLSIRVRQGTSGQIHLGHGRLTIEQTGTYTGTLVLTPDFECAYIDPDIKSIWAGNLEFPMSVTVTQKQ